MTEVEVFPNASSDIDCFYIYPTVALSGATGLVEDFSNIEDIKVPTRIQGLPFRGVCNLYVPLYHQVTLPTYLQGMADDFLDEAYVDIEAAFEVYWDSYNQGRDVVLLGHSQGAHMLRRLLQREFEGNPERMEKLVVAMAIGGGNELAVPQGEIVGGMFQSIPLCTSADERGCVMALDSHAKDSDTAAGVEAPDGLDGACTDPAALLGQPALLSGGYFPTSMYQGDFGFGLEDGLTTTFALYRDFFSGRCNTNDAGFSYYEVEATPAQGDVRENPVPLDDDLFLFSGLHVLDYNFPLTELISIVTAKIDAG